MERRSWGAPLERAAAHRFSDSCECGRSSGTFLLSFSLTRAGPPLFQLRCKLLVCRQGWAHSTHETPDLLRELPVPCFQEHIDHTVPAVDHGTARFEELRLTGPGFEAAI